ncbi:unnamed protein product [Lactuca saligna]|uniref:Uncharacterized protein n=1 Tax=Lactuca saligna TaxID=75948 RepID=A0AA35Y8V0_LACSI|nr:unnamed protein product [Lactuca saligna]
MNGRCEGTIGGPEGRTNEDDGREAQRLCRWHEVSVIDREKDRLLRGSMRPKGKSLEATVVSVGAARSCSSSFSVACFSPDSWLRRKYEEEVRGTRVGSIGATATPGGCLAAVFRQGEKRKCDEEDMKKKDGDEAVLLLEIKRKKKKRGCDRYKDREAQQPSSLAEDPETGKKCQVRSLASNILCRCTPESCTIDW